MPPVTIIKKSDDPLGVVRISVGGGLRISGYYCLYRGPRSAVVEALEAALEAMRGLAQEPALSPEHAGTGAEPRGLRAPIAQNAAKPLPK